MKLINHILVTAMALVAVAMFANASVPPVPAWLNSETGNYWVNYTWSKDANHPENDNVTDSFNVSMNGTWYNGTATFLNESVGPGGWANIMIWAYNRTGNGTMSVDNVSDNVQAPAAGPSPSGLTCTSDICVNETGWWRSGGVFNANVMTPIQAAVDDANAGETICVAAGSYEGNVNIETSHLTLVCEGADVVYVTANLTSDHVFEVTADYVNISGFTLTGATGSGGAGIHLSSSQHCNISYNTASNNDHGIYLYDSSNNTLTGNTISNNSDHDISIEDSPSNAFEDNTLNGTTISFTYRGDVLLKGEGSQASDPTGWYNISKFINATNQSVDAWLYLNFSYSGDDLGDLVKASLAVWKQDGTGWVKDGWDNGRYPDTADNVVGVNITSFSVFAPMGVLPLQHINVTPNLSQARDIGELQNFTATGYDREGVDASGYFAFEWDISDEYIGRFTEINDTVTNFTAEHAGIAYITASNGSVTSDQVSMTVDAAEPTNETVKNGTAIVTSGDANVTCDFGSDVTGWINITAIGNATNSSNVNSSNPRSGLGSGDTMVSGVTVNVSNDILAELEAGKTIRIEICYNATTLTALGIDANTLAIWKYYNLTETWVKQSSTIFGTCVYADVGHLCTFSLVGSKATGDGDTGGGDGTYPAGWFGTPTPTATATLTTPATTGTATTASHGERVTPLPTKMPAAAKVTAKTTTPAAECTMAGTAKNGALWFAAVFVIAGVLAIAYAMMRRRG